MYERSRSHKSQTQSNVRPIADVRIRIAALLTVFLGLLLGGRLFTLMVLQHDFYTALAAGSQEVYAQLVPERGEIFFQDSRTGETYPAAINKDVFTVYVDTRKITAVDERELILETLQEIFGFDEDRRETVRARLSKENDPYEPLVQEVEQAVVDVLQEKDLPGIGWVRQQRRYYPENTVAAQTLGFVGKDEGGGNIGRYGIEGYWNNTLAGSGGFFEGVRGLSGGWLTLAGRSLKEAEDGADLVLTADRTVQYQTCERLRAAMEEYGASSASAVVMDPHTGAIRAMCSLPDFNPNTYNEVEDVTVYNNDAIFTPYEPGSVFKGVTMAAALDDGVVTQNSVYHDSGSIDAGCQKSIRNADNKVYKDQTMTQALENSVNTAMVHLVKELGTERFRDYVKKFGFGVKGGVRLDAEASGTIDSLSKNRNMGLDCYAATASFGQGITATPLQMANAYAAIANGGTLLKPYIVDEIRHPSGRIDETKPVVIHRVMSEHAARLLRAMLVTVVDGGHAALAGVDGYYVAGKTGTAQIAERGGYIEDTNHTFVGFAPVEDPAFVMLIKFEKPERRFSASTAAPVFGDIAAFLLDYYQVPPGR